jgi:hypothetical protein
MNETNKLISLSLSRRYQASSVAERWRFIGLIVDIGARNECCVVPQLYGSNNTADTTLSCLL